MVVDLEALGLQRLEVDDLRLGLELQLLARGEFVTRGDPDDVAVLAHVQALGLQDDVERLVPGHVLQAQGQVALHRVGRDDIEVGEVGDDLQHRAHIHILEVQRELVALVVAAPAAELGRVLGDAPHLEHEAVVALVGVVLPQPVRGHGQAYAVAHLLGRHRGDRGGEVGDVGAAAQVVGQRGLQEVDDQVAALLADVDAGLRIRQVDHHAPLAAGAAAEVDVAHREAARGRRIRTRRGEVGRSFAHHRALHRARSGRRERDDEVATLHARLVGAHAGEVEHEPGAVAGLDDVGAAQVALVDGLHVAPEGVRGTRKIEGDARRVGHAEARRRAGERLAQGQAHVDRAALFGDLQRLDPVVEALRLRRVLGQHGRRGRQACESGCGQQHSDAVSHFPASWRSCNVSVLVRSTQSP